MHDLKSRVALVAGATRGAGRGIATALGERGATVYCTGRSTRGSPSPMGRPETIEETAERVTAAGGVGIPVRCDHADEADVAALCTRIRADHGGLDLLVNDVWGGEKLVEFGVPVWKMSIDKGRRMFDSALFTHLVTAKHAVPLLIGRERPLLVEVTDGDHFGYRGALMYDLAKMSVLRLAFGLSRELRAHGVTALAVTPGFLRSEEMLAHFGVTEATWREAADPHFVACSETPLFVGRAVAALAAEPEVARRNGRVFASWTLAREYGFTDADGTRPDWGAYFGTAFGKPWLAADEAAYATWMDGPLDGVPMPPPPEE
ncbi:MAG: SDR family oxidoreductase [Pseudomonadota bacterium]|nr:SDR family oxidoreductase [Pseudomonadota bacterium]